MSRRFAGNRGIEDVSFELARGTLVGFLGPNGAGKTTTMRVIMGIYAPDSGRVCWDGTATDRAVTSTFGYMPEERGLYTHMKVREQLVYMGRLRGQPLDVAKRCTDDWLEKLGLSDRSDSLVRDLSHGAQQRVQFGAAVLHRPPLLVLDEPFSGMDPSAVSQLSSLLRAQADNGAAVLLSSHQLELVEALCDAVVIINRGRVVAQGDVGALRQQADRRWLRVTFRGRSVTGIGALPGVWLDEATGRFALHRDADPVRVLDAVAALGQVDEFCIETPSLAELFRSAVE